MCNASEDMCLTVACFSDLMESVDFNLDKKDGHGYLTPQSAIAVDQSVRDWVYELAPADYKARIAAWPK